jgi:uncharacterized membrane protein
MEKNNFFKSLLNSKNSLSSKRFISLVGLILFVVVVISALFGISISDTITYALVSLILGGSVLSAIPNKNNDKPPNI